uniref:Uncharacterized protein n=1 Tax=Cacopsylla melanoneura TaxID=428564 RepID=A0A8D8Z7G3_9HEMI
MPVNKTSRVYSVYALPPWQYAQSYTEIQANSPKPTANNCTIHIIHKHCKQICCRCCLPLEKIEVWEYLPDFGPDRRPTIWSLILVKFISKITTYKSHLLNTKKSHFVIFLFY